MNHKKTILHIIQNFGIGGAETALVGVLKSLSEYNNIVVTLDDLNEFGSELKYDKYYSLDLRSYYLFPFAIKKLKKIIRENKVDLIHSQLYWSTILARFACPENIPLVTSIQSSLTDSIEYKKKWIAQLDRYSYHKKKSTILGVSKSTLDDYFDFLKVQPHRKFVLYNFVDTGIFNGPVLPTKKDNKTFKIITVGNLKPQKNQQFLLEAFKQLKGEGITLDIYGEGSLRPVFNKFIRDHDLPVRLMGKIRNLDEVIKEYDLFVMPSLYEGFSLAVLEGMVMEKPMLLSDIPTFREQAGDTASYFALNDIPGLVSKIMLLKNDPGKLNKMGTDAKNRVLQYFTLEHHMATLRKIYGEVLSNL